jgi:hypothetical protein
MLATLLGVSCCEESWAATLTAGPESYRTLVTRLRPGDVLELRPGSYREGLDVHRLVGQEGAPIVIRGASLTDLPVFVASAERNTISILDSAHVVVAGFELRGNGHPVDAVKAEGHARFAHHVTLERLRIMGYDAGQQNVAISTKCPTWNWVIRDNRIERAGTGMYLGNSDGSAPFVRGVIEGNVVVGTKGYAVQIKHQLKWPEVVDVAGASGETIIRYNTFVKDRHSGTGEMARPNVLLGHWPLSGRGAADRYLVYGNLFLDNPTEALLQAEGNLMAYNNVFINRDGDGVMLREHNDVPRAIEVFGNTILAKGTGLLLRNADRGHVQAIDGNAIFAGAVEPATLAQANFVRPLEHTASFLRNPAEVHGVPDLAPIGGQFAARYPPPRRAFLPDADVDFDRKPRGRMTVGAYTGGAPADPKRFGVQSTPSAPAAALAR